MPQTNWLFSYSDVEFAVRWLISHGCTVVPDQDYHSCSYSELIRWDDVDKVIQGRNNILLFVLSKAWQRAPLEMRRCVRGDEEFFFISQSNGGPSLEIYSHQPAVEAGHKKFGQGFVSYRSKYWNTVSQQNEKPASSLIACYNELNRELKRGGASLKIGTTRFFITAASKNFTKPQ